MPFPSESIVFKAKILSQRSVDFIYLSSLNLIVLALNAPLSRTFLVISYNASIFDSVDKLPEIVKNASLPLTNVNSITMYGEGNSSKLVGDIMTTTNKIMEGIEGSTGLNIKSLISSAVDGTLNEIPTQFIDNIDEN